MRFVTYDPNTGEITGRITCSTRQVANYPIKRAVTEDEYSDRPELFQKIDVSAADAPLVAMTEDEALAKGASAEFIAEKIAAGQIVGAEKI